MPIDWSNNARQLSSKDFGAYDLMDALAKGQAFGQRQQLFPMEKKYYPRQQEAEIFHKTIGPLAQLSISPLALAMQPEEQAQIAKMISQMMSNYPMGPYAGAGQEGNLLDNGRAVAAELTGNGMQTPETGNNPVNYQSQSSQSSAGLIPQAGKGLRAGAVTTSLAPYNKPPSKPGELYADPNTGLITSHPTESTIGGLQQQSTAIKALTPIIGDLATEAKPFLESGGTLKKYGGMAAGELSKLGVPESISNIFGDPKNADKFAKFKSSQATAIDKLMTALNLPKDEAAIDTVKEIIEPQWGETYQGYQNRMGTQLLDLQKKYQQNIETLGGGYQINQPEQPKKEAGLGNSKNVSKQLNKAGVDKLAKNLKMPVFKSKEEFQAWFQRQPKITQDAVKMKLGGN